MNISATVALLLTAALPSPDGQALVAPPALVPAPVAAPADPAAPAPATPDSGTPDSATDDLNAIIVSALPRATPGDPVEKVNAASYAVIQRVDTALIGPLAYAYRDGLPKPLRAALHNVLLNLDLPVNAINFMLQLKPVSALKTVGRLVINSTIGLGGLIDVAKKKPFGLPFRPNGFADTMGFYGIGPGPYLYLPLVGPTTVRDLLGLWLDRGFLPAFAGKPFSQPLVATSITVVRAMDYRIEFDNTLQRLNKEAADPYAATREFYLARRQAEIDDLKGKPHAPMALPPAQDAGAVSNTVPPVDAAPQSPIAETKSPGTQAPTQPPSTTSVSPTT